MMSISRLSRPSSQVLAAMAIYAAVFSALTILRYVTSIHGDADFGVFEQSFWTAAREGQLFFNTYEGGSHFRTHNSPIFLLLLPVYALLPSMITLLVLQAMAVALSAWPVYLLARHFLGQPPSTSEDGEHAGRLLAFTWLLYHPLHGVNYDQFNELSFAPAPLLFAFYFMFRERMGLYWLSLLLAMGCKEDMTFVVAMLGVYTAAVGIHERRPALVRHGVATVVVATGWLLLTLQVIFPYFRGGHEWPYFEHRYGHLGASLKEAVVTMVTRPEVMAPYLFRKTAILLFFELLAPLALIPLAAPGVLIVALPTWLILSLSSFTGTMNTGSRYVAPVIAVLFVALILGTRRVALRSRGDKDFSQLRRILRWPLILTLLFTLALNNTPVRVPFKNVPLPNAHLRSREALLAQLPPQASVSTQADFYGRVAHRVQAHMGYKAGVEYILVDATPPFTRWFANAGWDRELEPLVESGCFLLVGEVDGARLYRRAR